MTSEKDLEATAGAVASSEPPREESHESFIDTGDRVVIASDGSPNGFGGQSLVAHRGKHGLVLSNDGYGCCYVKLDDGSIVSAWNYADLEREATA